MVKSVSAIKRPQLHPQLPLYAFTTIRTTQLATCRSGSWRLIEFHEDQRCALYNLDSDLGELHGLAAQQPEHVAAPRDKLHAWRNSVNAQMPTPNSNHDPTRATQVARNRN